MKDIKLEDVSFSRGPSATIPETKLPGRLLVETDTGNVFLDDTKESRVQLTDTSKLSKHGDVLDDGASIEFKSGEDFIRISGNSIEGTALSIKNIRESLGISDNRLVWTSTNEER